MKRSLACVLLAVLLCIAGFSAIATENDLPIFPWLSYNLRVILCDEHPEGFDQIAVKDGDRLVRVCFDGAGEQIAHTDIEEHSSVFVLQDRAENAYNPLVRTVRGVTFVDGVFGTAPLQDGFELIFSIPEAIVLDDLLLIVDMDEVNEQIIVPMADVPRVMPEI